MLIRKLLSIAFLHVVCLVLAGCGGGRGDAPETVVARGKITYRNKPVARVSVAFTPEKGKVAMGETDEDGNFTLTTNKPGDGAAVGDYVVTLAPIPEETPDMFEAQSPRAKSASPVIPAKYADVKNSGLKATVTSDPEKNIFEFDLK